MTTIAWDGVTLAADRKALVDSIEATVCKIRRLPDGSLLGTTGDFTGGLAVISWIEAGADPEKLPRRQDTDDWVGVIQVRPDRTVWLYERGAVPFQVLSPNFALGSGQPFAATAMYLGHSAREAVEIACALDPHSGKGVDTLTLEPAP